MQEGTGPCRQRAVLKLVRKAFQKHKSGESKSQRPGKEREEAEEHDDSVVELEFARAEPWHPGTRNLAK